MSLRNNRAVLLAAAASVLLVAGLALALLWAPEDADQGFSQRIFYVHVPIALDGIRVLRLGCVEGSVPPLEAGQPLRPRELHRGPRRSDLRDPHARHGIHLGEDLLGCLVDVERAAADALPRPLPLLLRLLHAALLGRARAAAGESLGRLCALRRRAHPGQLPRHPPGREIHPPGRLHARWAADVREHVPSSSASASRRCSASSPPSTRTSWQESGLDAQLRELREAVE
jgi:hypothetical protein